MSVNAQDVGSWLVYFGNEKLDKRFNFQYDIQVRNYDLKADLEQLLLRGGFGYNLTENNNNILLGYAFIHNENYINFSPDEKVSSNEHRIYQQFTTKQSFGRFNLQHRYRLEERFFESEDITFRGRYFLQLNVPINHKSMTDKDTWYVTGYNELFINFDSNHFDRNRLYGGLGYVFNKKLSAELGYLNQYQTNNSRNNLLLTIRTNNLF